MTARFDVLGVSVHAVTMDEAVERVISAARDNRPLGVTALAVHGVMCAVDDPELLYRINDLELVVPDGQPVRWGLNWIHRVGLRERVYGPDLMLAVCRRAEEEQLGVFLFGSTPATLDGLTKELLRRYPALRVSGAQSSRFRDATPEEHSTDTTRITESGARIVFVGLGCPRQETWAYESRSLLRMPIIAVGAAFDYHAGMLRRPPAWMQRAGLEWAHRLLQEPRRLWRRYLLLNPRFLWNLALQRLGKGPSRVGSPPRHPTYPG